jgi:hypothetical protein
MDEFAGRARRHSAEQLSSSSGPPHCRTAALS